MNIKHQAELIKYIGLTNYLIGVGETLKNCFMQNKFKFNKWHTVGYNLRPYKKQVVSIANSLTPNVVVEVGCGIGEIIHRIQAIHKIGIDVESNAINAAKYMYESNQTIFKEANFIETENILTDLCLESIDLLIMVNWPHQIPIELIQKTIKTILLKKKINYIIIDSINKNFKGYKYYHSINELEKIGKIYKVTPGIDGIRSFIIIDLNQC